MSQHFEVRLETASGFLFSGQEQRNKALILELQNQQGWKRPLRSSGPTVSPLPPWPLNHNFSVSKRSGDRGFCPRILCAAFTGLSENKFVTVFSNFSQQNSPISGNSSIGNSQCCSRLPRSQQIRVLIHASPVVGRDSNCHQGHNNNQLKAETTSKKGEQKVSKQCGNQIYLLLNMQVHLSSAFCKGYTTPSPQIWPQLNSMFIKN